LFGRIQSQYLVNLHTCRRYVGRDIFTVEKQDSGLLLVRFLGDAHANRTGFLYLSQKGYQIGIISELVGVKGVNEGRSKKYNGHPVFPEV
jgi:hypothetical protein